ncbi:hypothetical protein V492_03005 [Pseudogymnoascus sp. VKM F-4246]|nr:hypothetical protein V492_03005 [Pseudogymnoascus sp. VKM F-4246]
MAELFAEFTVPSIGNGTTNDAIIMALAGIIANVFWHIIKHSCLACFGEEPEITTEQKLKDNEHRDATLEYLHEELDNACKDRDKYFEKYMDYWKQRDRTRTLLLLALAGRSRALNERDEAYEKLDDVRTQRDAACRERDELQKDKLYDDKLRVVVEKVILAKVEACPKCW